MSVSEIVIFKKVKTCSRSIIREEKKSQVHSRSKILPLIKKLSRQNHWIVSKLSEKITENGKRIWWWSDPNKRRKKQIKTIQRRVLKVKVGSIKEIKGNNRKLWIDYSWNYDAESRNSKIKRLLRKKASEKTKYSRSSFV